MGLAEYFKRLFKKEKPVVGLALGGGGARGLAHFGVLKVLQEHQVPIDTVVGTSMGAIVGAGYCQNPDVSTLTGRMIRYLESQRGQEEEMRRSFKRSGGRLSRWTSSLSQYYFLVKNPHRSSILDESILDRLVNSVVDDGLIEETKLPFSAVAVDLLSGEPKITSEGSILKAVKASSSIPGVFPPLKLDECLLVDGGVSSVVPVKETLSREVDVTIAVDVGSELDREPLLNRGVNLLFRLNGITRNQLKACHLSLADIVIRPQVQEYQWYEFNDYKRIISEGESATKEIIGKVEEYIQPSRVSLPWSSSG